LKSSLASDLKRRPLTCEYIWNSIHSSGNKSAVRSTCITFEASTAPPGPSRSFLAMRRPRLNTTLEAQTKPILRPAIQAPKRIFLPGNRKHVLQAVLCGHCFRPHGTPLPSRTTILIGDPGPGTSLQCCASIVYSSTLINNTLLPLEFRTGNVPIGVNCTITTVVSGCGEIAEKSLLCVRTSSSAVSS
jgi:hypothetical protein